MQNAPVPHWSARRAFREGWALARPFWRAPDQRRAWALLAAVVALTLGTVWINVRFSVWNNRFYDTLQNHDLAGFWHQLVVFGLLAAMFIVVAVYRQYLQQVLFMQWRTWLTRRLLDGWLRPGTAFRLGHGERALDNPDQRVAEDARGFVSSSLDLSLGLLNAGVTLASFIGILWALSGTLTIPLGQGIRVPGYMVWVAIAYSLGGTWLNQRLGRPLAALNGEQQRVEANFRYQLVQIREHAEAIGLASGEHRELTRLTDRFDAIRANWAQLIRITKRLTWFSAGYGQVANVFPILAAAPRYFSGALKLGGLMQTAQAFGQVQGALSWFIDAYPRLADWRATVHRLTLFTEATSNDALASTGDAGIRRSVRSDGMLNALSLSDLSVETAEGRLLAGVSDRTFVPGERLLITGPSGSGKSSLLRAVAGLWRHGRGRIGLPAGAKMMFVSQRPYLPAGTLRQALAYPADPLGLDAHAAAIALGQAGLGRYAQQLDEGRPWLSTLSPGEQQRLHFARVFLRRPDWVFLDESTSALDETAERELYQTLHAVCPRTTVVSVGHRSSLIALHDVKYSMDDRRPPSSIPLRAAA